MIQLNGRLNKTGVISPRYNVQLRDVEKWEQSIRDRELAEKRRKAPGWLDSEDRLLEPEKKDGKKENVPMNLMDAMESKEEGANERRKQREVDDLGRQMDKAFGRSEMG